MSVLLGVSQGIADAMAELLLSEEMPEDALQRLEAIAGAYSQALERILGAPAGSLPLVDVVILKEWLVVPSGNKRNMSDVTAI